MTNCMHFIHPPKIIQIWWGRHDNFVSGKNRPLLLTKSVHWCFIHVYSAFMARNLGYFAKKVDDIPPTLTTNNLFGLTWFLCIRYKHTKYVDHFFILEIQFFCWEKNTKLGTSPTRRHVMNCQLYKFVIVIDWSMKCDFFLSAECRHALNYGHTDLSIASMTGIQLCTVWIVSNCFNIHAYSIIFYKENAT